MEGRPRKGIRTLPNNAVRGHDMGCEADEAEYGPDLMTNG